MLLLSSLLSVAAMVTGPGPDPRAPLISFGASMVMVGDELLVGRPSVSGFFPLPPSENGAVFGFRRDGAGWVQGAVVRSADAKLGDGFGATLAADGSLLAVGAPHAAGGGAVYLFERAGSGWRQVARVAPPAGGEHDGFGQSLALSGDLLVVGAPGRDSARGAAYAVRRAAGGWGSPTALGRGGEADDSYGAAVAIAGDRVLVGAPGPSPLGGPFGGGKPPRAGAVTTYRASADGWAEAGALTVGADSVAGFGWTLVADGPSVYVAAPMTERGRGVVYEFRPSGESWSVAAKVAPSVAGGMFGFSLAAAGDRLLVGMPLLSQLKGRVQAFERAGAGWTSGDSLTVDAVGMLIGFGSSIVASGDLAVVGAPGADFFEGLGYVFARTGPGRWVERGTVMEKGEGGLAAITGGERRCTGTDIDGFDCKNVDILSFLPTRALGAKRGIMVNDLWGWTDEQSGREFALVGRLDGTAFVEITDPVNPKYLGDLPLHAGATVNIWRDIKTYHDHAFIVADGAGPHGMQVFDLRQLLDVKGPPVTFQETAHYDQIASAHNIVIDPSTGFAYTVGNSGGGETCGGALHMIDIRDPAHPTFAGCFADKSTGNARTGYTHDAQCTTYHGPDARYAGRQICFNASETAIGIADVTDKANPKPIAVAEYPNTAYAHQGWLTDDHKYFFLDDEGDEIEGKTPKTRTMVWDVTKLDEPVLVKEFLGTTAASDHNLYIKGRYMFQSDYVAGLRVIDISDPVNPREVGYLDTLPFGDNVPGFAGSWSNYPFFKSGTIIVSSMREGLFVVRHRPERPIP